MNILADRIIRWGFYALFPGFFAYHFLVAKEWLPPVLGGYSSAMAALLVRVVASVSCAASTSK